LAKTDTLGNSQRPKDDLPVLRRTFFVIETESHYEALVRLEDGQRRASGRAQEPRWSQGWARYDGGVVLLERVPRPRRNAIAMCVLKAYRRARAAWRNGAASNGDEPGNKTGQKVKA
jgi:hypothetical protein